MRMRNAREGSPGRPLAVGKRLRVAFFVPPSDHFAGIERVTHEIAAGLMDDYADQLDVHVIFARHYDSELLIDTAYQLHVLNVDRLRQLAPSLRALVRAQQIDVFVCPQIEASVTAWVATRGLGLPMFLTHLHGNPRIEEVDGTVRTRVAFALFRHVLSRRIAGVLAVSPSLARYARSSVTRHAQVHFVKNPVRALVATEIERSAAGPFRFLSVGRLSRQKGQSVLLHALAVARPDLPPVSLTIVGSGPDDAELRALCERLALTDVVTFAGYDPDPANRFLGADCFVLPSLWEGFGLVMVEALQFGLPLLASDCEFGPADIITDPRIGELVPAGDVPALAEGLARAAQRVPRDADRAFRQESAAGYGRAPAAAMHRDVLVQIAAAHPPRSARVQASAQATSAVTAPAVVGGDREAS